MVTEEIRDELFRLQDVEYRDFQAKLIPGQDVDKVIGCRTPALRKLAKGLVKREDVGEFLEELPHEFFDEKQLHAFIVSEMKDFDRCMEEVERFLPFVDNWATCDQMSPKVFKKHRQELLEKIRIWIKSDRTYTIRFGVGMLMEHFLDEDFDPAYPAMVAELRPGVPDDHVGVSTPEPATDEYYIRMMIAWYFATALAKQYETVIPYVEEQKLDTWTHNKAIQKSVESYRITPEQKEYLKSLKRKKTKTK
ncbi:MAG: DNA alkylation repair protein [Eubacterium sp.]|nr:DNA alkylation repair protein [Eubacterium sp.]